MRIIVQEWFSVKIKQQFCDLASNFFKQGLIVRLKGLSDLACSSYCFEKNLV